MQPAEGDCRGAQGLRQHRCGGMHAAGRVAYHRAGFALSADCGVGPGAGPRNHAERPGWRPVDAQRQIPGLASGTVWRLADWQDRGNCGHGQAWPGVRAASGGI